MSDPISEDRLHRILNDKLEERDSKLDKVFEEQRKDNKETADTLQKQDKQLERIELKLGNIYGNGSGRKCILDRIEDRQNVSDTIVKDEATKQQAFRHEVRGIFETLQLKDEARTIALKEEQEKVDNGRKNKKEWIKWVVGGVAVVLWELIKIHWLKVK